MNRIRQCNGVRRASSMAMWNCVLPVIRSLVAWGVWLAFCCVDFLGFELGLCQCQEPKSNCCCTGTSCTMNAFTASLNFSNTGFLVDAISSPNYLLLSVSACIVMMISLCVMILGGCLLVVGGESLNISCLFCLFIPRTLNLNQGSVSFRWNVLSSKNISNAKISVNISVGMVFVLSSWLDVSPSFFHRARLCCCERASGLVDCFSGWNLISKSKKLKVSTYQEFLMDQLLCCHECEAGTSFFWQISLDQVLPTNISSSMITKESWIPGQSIKGCT